MTYAIGIDLGTTHSAVAAVDLDLSEGDEIALSVLGVPQSTSPGQVESKKLLPSFLYLPNAAGGELPAGSLALPWEPSPRFAVGELARLLGQKTPLRLVSSAKSWLGHAAVDRRAPILPPKTDETTELERVSPLAAQIAYLSHLRAAWDAANEDAPMQEQDVVLTVPASFDPAARELTAEAAREAGLGHAVLLEEPQAALYAWIERSHGKWRDEVKVGDVILVVDLGGGTTDFSLIAVHEKDGSLELRRVAVGDHILLGGDNMDLALAAVVKQRLEGEGKLLDAFQSAVLVHACRGAKEALLADGAPESVPVVVPTRGSKLVAGSIRTEVSRADVTKLLVDGFFPDVEVTSRPITRARAAITELGLPYAQDAAVTRHLAAFLARQIQATGDLAGFANKKGARFLHPTAVLFNGGVLRARVIQERILEVLSRWLAADGAPPARLLAGADLDLAVARGAAYYAYVRRGKGVRIRGGTAKSYYVGVESAMPAVPGMEPPLSALCIAPFGMEEGTVAPPARQELGLVVGEPVQFRFFESATRRDDQPGTMLDRIGDDLSELPPLEATMPAEGRPVGDVVPVRLGASVTEVGTLRLEAFPREGKERWKVELEVRRG
ncbi:MAG: Hsp70 family protein [Sandaracinus sp.]